MNPGHTPPRNIPLEPHANACCDVPASQRCSGITRIILADDHPVVLMGARMALTFPANSRFSVVAEAHNADELIQRLECCPCDILVCDYSMPYGRFPDGLALMSYVKRHFSHVQLIVMTMLHNPTLLQALLNNGVRGLYDKHSTLSELRQALHIVSRGRPYLSPSFASLLDAQALFHTANDEPQVSLSQRELEVVRLFVQGLSGRQIAAQLNRSEKTISRQKRTAMDKLGLGHDSGLVEFARLSGLCA